MCKFCKQLEQVKDTDRYYSKPNCKTEYKSAFLTYNYYKEYPTGTCTYGGYELNFCPECGKKINENNKK